MYEKFAIKFVLAMSISHKNPLEMSSPPPRSVKQLEAPAPKVISCLFDL